MAYPVLFLSAVGACHSFMQHVHLYVQLICGVFQSSGWPPVVAVVANWFGKGRFAILSVHVLL